MTTKKRAAKKETPPAVDVAADRVPASLRKFTVSDTGCWMWQGTLRPNGYGRVWYRGRTMTAHQAVWVASGRDLSLGLELDHLCRQRGCVNPGHLEPVSRAENNRRKATAQTHCKNGHALAGDNLVVTPHQRKCR